MAGRLGSRLLSALLVTVTLAGCDRADPDRARICRLLVEALEPEARDFQELPPDAARDAGYDVKIAFRAHDDGGVERDGWIACRFARGEAGAGVGEARPRLAAVATDRTGPLDEAALFWLEQWRGIAAREAIDARRAGRFAVEEARPDADDPWLPALYFAQQLVNAAALAGVYALLSLSFTLVYGIVGRINFAFGELYMIGAVLSGVWAAALAAVGLAGWAVSLTLVFAVCLGTVAVHGWAMERLAFRPLRDARGHAPLIVAIGLSIALREAVRLLHGAGDVWIAADYGLSFTLAGTHGFDVVATWKQVVLVGLTAVVLVVLVVVFRRTRFGLSYRACADDGRAAALLGVDVARTIAGTFALGGALAGLAGFALLQYYGVANFFMGFVTGFKALTAAILGGIGSIPGAVVGGVLIALLETFWSAYIGAEYRDVAVFGVLALVLVFRPGGLMGVETERIAQPDRA